MIKDSVMDSQIKNNDFSEENMGIMCAREKHPENGYDLYIALGKSKDKVSQIQKKILKGILVINHIENMIKKCDVYLDEIENGHFPKPPTWNGDDAIWNDIMEERHEYLEGLRSKLSFIIEHPEREQIV